MWYIDIRLSNPNTNRDDIITYSTHILKKKFKYFTEYIRSYALFIHIIELNTIKYLKNRNLTPKQEKKEIRKIINDIIKKHNIT